MLNYSAESYGDAVAAVFDIINDNPAEVANVVAFLRENAGAGPVFEPGIGTGRIAIPLAAAGLEVYGVDISAKMIDQLRGKPGAQRVTAEVADMTEADFGRQFSLVYLVQGTFGALLTEPEQRRFLEHTRKRLTDDGRVVIETMEVDDTRFSHDQYVAASLLDVGHVALSAAIREPDKQHLSIQNILLTAAGVQLFPVKFRYHTAAQLDAMAAAAGLRLIERYSDWTKAEYSPGDLNHISVYRAN